MKSLNIVSIKSISLLVIFYGLVTESVSAQSTDSLTILSFEQAIDYALLNNRDIEIQRKEVEIAENKVKPGEAGLRPRVTLISEANYTNNQSDVEIRTFMDNPATINFDNESNVETASLNSRVQLDYVIFSGFSGKYRYKLLQNTGNLARYQQEVIINNSILAVADIFFEIAKLQYQEDILRQSLRLDSARLKKVEDKQAFARSSGLDILNAKTNINLDLNALDEIRLQKFNLITKLNFVMGIDPASYYQVDSKYLLASDLALSQLEAIIEKKNPLLKLLREDINLSNNRIKLNKARLYPRISSFASYGFFEQRNDLQQLAEVQNLGFNTGISLRYNLFDGKQVKRNIENAELNNNLSVLKFTQAKEELINNAIVEINNQKNLKIRLEREQENLKTFQENYQRTEDRYLVGKANSLEVREAQLTLLAAQLNINQMKIDLLKSSLRLESIKGTLVNN